MKTHPLVSQSDLLQAFLNSTQYIVRLKAQQDLWEHLSQLVMTHFPAAWVAFVSVDGDTVSVRHIAPGGVTVEAILTEEIQALVREVRSDGFLATGVLREPDSTMVTLFPVLKGYQADMVMMIGHGSLEALPKELLNTYLAVASLAGSAFERLENEQELNRHRAILESLVKERTADLSRAKKQNELLLHSVSEGICGLDLEGRITFVNPAASRALGWEATELIGRNAHSTFHHPRPGGARHPGEECPVQAALSDGLPRSVPEDEFRRKDGTLIQVEFTAGPILEDARIAGAVLVFRDITDKKIAESRLAQTSKMESVGRLAGGVAHDFNNLLTVINGYAQLVLSGLNPADPLRGQIEAIHTAGERAAELTRQLLAFSRKQVLQLQVLDLNQLVDGMLAMLRRLMVDDVECGTALSPHCPRVSADSHQLEQVIMNLAANARDAMPRGGRMLIETGVTYRDESYARLHPDVPAGSYAMLAVTDTGVGIDEVTRQRIFEPFFTTKGVGEGTGLGLSTVQGIVAQSGGHIEVYSEPGQGATFKIYLPSVAAEPHRHQSPKELADLRGNERVLVVEDQAAVRTLTVSVLKKYGYQVIEAAGAGEALMIIEREGTRVHLVLTDVMMPHMSGRELVTGLQKMCPGLKSLFMSGFTADVLGQRGVLDDGAQFIQKPFTPDALAEKVRAILGRPAPGHAEHPAASS